MALVNNVLPSFNAPILAPRRTENPSVRLSSLDRECQILKRNVQISPLRTARSSPSYSRSITKCIKGIAFPTPDVIEKLVDGAIIPSEIVPKPHLTRKDFPADFKFGCSTSAFQTEGSGTEGGRGPSTWDIFIGTGQKAVDSYNRYKEDVQKLKEMGADTYRMSISWSRILPDGTLSGGVNQAGVDFYNNFIDELIKNGITPFVTLFHFDLPTALQNKYNGFLDSQIVDDFKAYADLCFKTFGNRVKFWVTINEPQVFGQFGYKVGLKIPDQLDYPFRAIHNIILAHATAAKHYKENYQPTQKGEIGTSLVTEWFEPSDESRDAREAAERAFDFLTGWMLEPLVFGDYPFIMKALVGDALPSFTDDQKALVKGSYDFVGVNYYTSRFATSLPMQPDQTYTSIDQFQHVDIKTDNTNGKLIGEKAPGSSEVFVYPKGLGHALDYITKEYNKPKIYITENGYPEARDDSIPIETALQDDGRIQHILTHLQVVSEALKNGVNVKSYLMWSLMDCLEMGSGYNVRYGLYYTDYNTLNRIPKKSAKWFKSSFLK